MAFLPRARVRSLLATLVGLALLAVPASAAASPVIVQGTTDVTDAGLVDDVIVPGFEHKYPQYQLEYIPVGTGQAIANVEAGQGDALLVHAPTQEVPFVNAGFSDQPFGRAIFYSDYVIIGPADDPAGVMTGAAHNAAQAFQLIANAGAAGTANFVSRGDNSGTNTEEKTIWQLTGVPLNSAHEPAGPGGTGNASWYHKAGAGQAQTVQIAAQCPFAGGGCYDITDRGTYNRLVSLGAVTTMKIVSQDNDPHAPGGRNLLTNPFTAYAINPAKVPGVNVAGAKALLDYLTSPNFQQKLVSYPSKQSPAFFPDAAPKLNVADFDHRVRKGDRVKIKGNVRNRLPGSPRLAGAPIRVQEQVGAGHGKRTFRTLDGSPTNSNGHFSLKFTAKGPGRLQLVSKQINPRFNVVPLLWVGSLEPTSKGIGKLKIKASHH